MVWLNSCVILLPERDSWKYHETPLVASCYLSAPAAVPMIRQTRVQQAPDASLLVSYCFVYWFDSINNSIHTISINYYYQHIFYYMKETKDWINTLLSRHCIRFGFENTTEWPRNWLVRCLDARIIFIFNKQDASSSLNSNTLPTTNTCLFC